MGHPHTYTTGNKILTYTTTNRNKIKMLHIQSTFAVALVTVIGAADLCLFTALYNR